MNLVTFAESEILREESQNHPNFTPEQFFNERKLMLQAMSELTDYQQPRFYQCFAEFPKSALGKILKQKIKAKLIAINTLKIN